MTRILGLLVATVTRAGATGLIGLRSVLNAEPDETGGGAGWE